MIHILHMEQQSLWMAVGSTIWTVCRLV